MTENELFALVLGLIEEGLPLRGFPNVDVSRAYQPTREARGNMPQILMFKVGGRRYGFPSRFERWNEAGNTLETVERTNMETTLQLNALVPQDPANLTQLTASDFLEAASSILQTESFQTALKQLNAGVLRITDVTNTPFRNDREQYEFSPSFTVTISHVKEFVYPVAKVTGYDVSIKRV